MTTKKENYEFNEIIKTLDVGDQKIIEKLHKTIILWDYSLKISSIGKSVDDWKCEYKKNKHIILILQINKNKWIAKCKLYNILQYSNVLEQCNEHIKETLINSAKGCGHHGGGCKGPISFIIDEKTYSICRHSINFIEVNHKDIKDIIKLLENENNFI